MKHYDDLIERLRKGTGLPVLQTLMNEAADAIEELQKPKWISVKERLPSDFVSVQAHMTDAGPLPSVRESFVVNGNWFFPALREFHPVDFWARFEEPPKEET